MQETNCCFTQFNRIRNDFFGRWIEIRRDSCSRFVGSDCFFLRNTTQTTERPGRPVVNDKNQRSQGMTNVFNRIDCVPSNVQYSHQEALLYIFEDNEAVIKMNTKGRSPTMRHVSRTHRVALDWLFDRINLDSKIQIKYIDTKNQLADILTKGNLTRDEWNRLLNLFNISHFSSTACTAAMAKRAQQGSGEERVTAKSRPMMNLTARMLSALKIACFAIKCAGEPISAQMALKIRVTSSCAPNIANGFDANNTSENWCHSSLGHH